MMDYLKLLNRSYEECKKDDTSLSPLEFLSENIFRFTTYENIISQHLASKCLEVCQAVTERKVFEYIKSDEGELWYLTMVNMPFLEHKLEWGTSIRGAWWDLHGAQQFHINSCGLYDELGEQILSIYFYTDEWSAFIRAMMEFASEEESI